jgi:SWIM zinc finger
MHLLKEIKSWAMKKLHERQEESSKLLDLDITLTPYAIKEIAKYSQHAHKYNFEMINDAHRTYLIETDRMSQWTVNVPLKTCTCARYQGEGLPCVHALAVSRKFHVPVKDLCYRPFLVKSWVACYADGAINPVVVNVLERTKNRLPPFFKKAPGRLRKRRIPNTGSSNIGNTKYRGKCRTCRQPGHYQATCTNLLVEGSEENSSGTEEEVGVLEDAVMIDI